MNPIMKVDRKGGRVIWGFPTIATFSWPRALSNGWQEVHLLKGKWSQGRKGDKSFPKCHLCLFCCISNVFRLDYKYISQKITYNKYYSVSGDVDENMVEFLYRTDEKLRKYIANICNQCFFLWWYFQVLTLSKLHYYDNAKNKVHFVKISLY